MKRPKNNKQTDWITSTTVSFVELRELTIIFVRELLKTRETEDELELEINPGGHTRNSDGGT